MNGYAMTVALLLIAFIWAAVFTGQDRARRPPPPKKPRLSASERARRMRAIQKGLEAAGHEVGLYDSTTGEVYVLAEDDTNQEVSHREQEERRRYGKPGR